MKKFLLALSAAGIITVVTNAANAQNSVNPEILEPQKNALPIEKVLSKANDNMAGTGLVSPKALKDFTRHYKKICGERWQKIQDGFATKFTQNDVAYTVYYNSRGKWTGSLKRYIEDKMPRNIRDIVKREYYDYSILSVYEAETVESRGIPTYFIRLEFKDNIKLVRVNDRQMDVQEDFQKS